MTPASIAMEEKLYSRLGVKEGRVLDAGCGSGYVAMTMARHGLDVAAVDITPVHLEDAKRNVKRFGLEDKISVQYGDYHNLTDLESGSFSGVYTMETFVHADDPVKVLKNFYRLLKPGGVLVHHEADWSYEGAWLQDVLRLSHCENTLEKGRLEEMLTEVGFVDVNVEDLSDRVLPMWRLMGIVAYVPYKVLKAVGLQNRFTNLMAAVEVWVNWGEGRYISVRAVKP